MRLLKIGRDAGCDIVLPSNKVSSLHAEIILKDSGDIIIEDKGSRNGTYVMNQRIVPGKSVSIRRGDRICFADVELNWNQIPMPEDNSAYVALYGIGTHFDNDIQISGSTVSRYHATVKVGRDGKVYLFDHSKNGTTVDGKKLMPHNPYRIKKSSAVVCGGVPVDLSRTVKWPTDITSYFRWIGGVAAAVLLIVGLCILSPRIIGHNDSNNVRSIEDCQKATALVYGEYFIDVTIKDDPFVDLLSSWPKTWTFGLNDNGDLVNSELYSGQVHPLGYTGTAFFISEYGEMGTNRHVALPWEYLGTDTKNALKIEMQKLQSNEMRPLLLQILQKAIISDAITYDNAIAYLELFNKCQFEVSGHMSYMGVALTGSKISSKTDFINCQVIASSPDDDKDVALLRLNSPKTPIEITRWFCIEKARLDEQTLRPQQEELTTMGYPRGMQIAFNSSNRAECLPTVHNTKVSKRPDANEFQIQTVGEHGQSGSPIVDKDFRLVGVLYGGFERSELTYACNIKHLKALYDANKITIFRE